jgi:hypothetical protein
VDLSLAEFKLAQWVRFHVVESISRLNIGVCIFLNLFYNLIGVILSMVDDISMDSETLKVTSLILKVYRLSLLKMLVWIKFRACFHRIESMCVFVSVAE